MPLTPRAFLATFAFVFTLTACASVPGLQTAGLASDPESQTKALLVAMGLTVDAVGVYGRLPECRDQGPRPCHKANPYRDAKLIANAVLQDAEALAAGRRSALAQIAIFGLTQWHLVKVISDDPEKPTNPELPPRLDAVAYIDAIDAADLLVSTADDRVQDAFSVNTSVADLLTSLREKVQALP